MMVITNKLDSVIHCIRSAGMPDTDVKYIYQPGFENIAGL